MPVLKEIFLTAVTGSGPAFYSKEQVETWASLAKRDDDFKTFVNQGYTIVYGRESPAAFATLTDDGRISAVYVKPDQQRMGVGTVLLQALLSRARTQAITRVYSETNMMSLPLFQKVGFTHYDTEVVERGNVSFKRFLVQLDLTERATTS